MNVLAADKKLEIRRLRAQGLGIRAIERATGVHRDTITRLLKMKSAADVKAAIMESAQAIARCEVQLSREMEKFDDLLDEWARRESGEGGR